MTVLYYGKRKKVYQVIKKGGAHQYYTIFDNERKNVVNDDTDVLIYIDKKNKKFVKEIRVNHDAYICYSIDKFPLKF